MKNYKRSLKNFGRGLKGTAITLVGVGLTVTPYTAPLGLATLTKGINDIVNSVNGNYIENSIMTVKSNKLITKLSGQPSNYIVQGLPSISQFMQATLTENKMDFLKLQEVNLLLGLDTYDNKGNQIEYNTNTHIGNYRLLKKLENEGIISGLTKEPSKKSDLKVEKLLIGNVNKSKEKEYRKKRIQKIKENVSSQKGFFNKIKLLSEELKIGINKKTQMYKVSFKKTNKEFKEEDIAKMLSFTDNTNSGKINKDKFNLILDKDGNVKGIDYTKKYVLGKLKEKAKEKLISRKQNRTNNLKDNLASLTYGN